MAPSSVSGVISFAKCEGGRMEKETGLVCPRCGQESLNVYYEEGSDLQLGATCNSCNLKGFFMNGELIQLATGLKILSFRM
jgi:ribosomal protein L37E